MSRLELPYLRATSATLAETMRLCQLRAGLSRAAGSHHYVLGNPKGWLGTAYHEVLERIGAADFTTRSVEAVVDGLWDEAIAKQHQRASAHPLDRRFGPPSAWPGYHLARASALLRARDLLAERQTAGLPDGGGSQGGTTREIREEEFRAFDGKLIGRPDVIRDGEIVDYKSGAIVELEEGESDVVKAAYIRQLRIYGYLVKQTLGWWAGHGLLLPPVGPGIKVALEPAECEQEARSAVALLDAYNARIDERPGVAAFASPSPESCKWCPFKPICQPFWDSVSSEWSGLLDGAVIEGMATAAPRVIHGGAAVALLIEVHRGSAASGPIEVAPLQAGMHPAVNTINVGDAVRLLGLWARPDGTVAPTRRTVVARLRDLPLIDLANQTTWRSI